METQGKREGTGVQLSTTSEAPVKPSTTNEYAVSNRVRLLVGESTESEEDHQ